MWTTWLACRSDAPVERALGPLPRGEAPLWIAPTPAGGGVRLHVAPGAAEVALDGGDDHRAWEVPPDGLDLDVVALLPDTPYTLSTEAGTVRWRSATPDGDLCPAIDVLAFEPGRVDAGWLLLPHDLRVDGGSCTLLLDEALRPRWWWVSRGESVQDAVVGPDGHVWMRTAEGDVFVVTPAGDPVVRYASEPEGEDVPLPIPTAHHELLPQPDGSFWTFGRRVESFEVPVAYGADETEVSAVDDTIVQHVAADGTLLRSFDPLDAMEPGRCGFDGLAPNHGGVDFLHANALVPLPDDRVLISVRNQDVHLMLGPDDEVQWRFGDPAGWSSPWADTFLAPEGRATWPYHSHGVDFDPATGELLVFDNRPDGGSPYSGPGPRLPRVAAWRVDEAARTVEFVGERLATSTGPMASPIMGDADGSLLGRDHVLGVWAWVPDEGDGPVAAAGWGDVVARVVEFDGPDVVLDLRLRVDGRRWPGGGYVFRAERVAPWLP